MFYNLLNIVYIIHIFIFTILYIAGTPILVLVFSFTKTGKLDDIFRLISRTYGCYLINTFRPFIKINITGKENIVKNRVFIIVYNHFSEIDVAFSTLIPIKNQVILARDWVYNVIPFGIYMRMAKYINIDKTPFKLLCIEVEKYFKRNISLQIYPEGHRSKNGTLHRFRKGAFLLSCKYNIPILPVCMFNTNDFFSTCFPFFNPVKINIKILSPVYPEEFNNKDTELRDYVKKLYQKEFQ